MGFWNRKKEKGLGEPFVTVEMAVATKDENANKTVYTDSNIKDVVTFGPSETKEEEKEDVKPKEKEWIWVEGYKAVNPDMTAKWGEMTYEVGKVYEMEGDISLCENGYHFCLKPRFIRQYYQFGRLFKVRAEVEKEEYEKMKDKGAYTYKYKSWHPYGFGDYTDRTVDKMVARKIELVEEITDYKIIKEVWENDPLFVKNEADWWDFIDFCDQNQCRGHEDDWARYMFIKKMMACGFSETIALVLFKRLQRGWINSERVVEFAEGLTQMDISNDMKMFLVTDEVTKWHRPW